MMCIFVQSEAVRVLMVRSEPSWCPQSEVSVSNALKVERIGNAHSDPIRADVNAKRKCQVVHFKESSDPNRLVRSDPRIYSMLNSRFPVLHTFTETGVTFKP